MNRPTLRHRQFFPFIIAAVLVPLLLAGCTEPKEPGTKFANKDPETRLSNVPPPGTISTSPLVSLSWLGDDADGFVVAYRYRWSFQQSDTSAVEYKPYTYILNIMAGTGEASLALILLGDETVAPAVYKYFSTLPPEGLDTASLNLLARGDTLYVEGVGLYASNPDDERYPTHENPSRGTFIFDSQDSLNPHIFEVSAIDNNGVVDGTPAAVDFSTPLVPPPDVEVVDGPGFLDLSTTTFSDTVIVLDDLTDTYEGILFRFQGYDPNSRTIEYSWVVDRDLWPPESLEAKWSPFSLDPTARIKGTDLRDHYATDHTIYVRGRNEFGSISTRGFFTRPSTTGEDTTWAYAHFRTIYPEFARVPATEKRILLINNTFNWDTLAQPPVRPARADLLQYYTELYDAVGLAGKYDIYTIPYDRITLSSVWPGLGLFGKYSMIHIVGDVGNAVYKLPTISSGAQEDLLAYCYAGGKLLVNGWNLTRGDIIPPSTNFWNNILHIFNQTPTLNYRFPVYAQYQGAYHQTIPDASQYPEAPVDQLKLDTAWHGGMPSFHIYQAYGFGEIIYRFDAVDDNAFAQQSPQEFPQPLEGGVVGIRYIGLTYDVIYLGFPLYYTEQPAAIEVLRKALRDLKHL